MALMHTENGRHFQMGPQVRGAQLALHGADLGGQSQNQVCIHRIRGKGVIKLRFESDQGFPMGDGFLLHGTEECFSPLALLVGQGQLGGQFKYVLGTGIAVQLRGHGISHPGT